MALTTAQRRTARTRQRTLNYEEPYRHLGRTGTAGAKVALRRLAARSVDLFIANNPPARDYLIETLKVPRSRIVTGWWLAGLPARMCRPA